MQVHPVHERERLDLLRSQRALQEHYAPGETPAEFPRRFPGESTLEVKELLDEEGTPAARVVQSADRMRHTDATWMDRNKLI